jgi:NADPH:quinone reductase-like Zn-dependent oxidoreductase
LWPPVGVEPVEVDGLYERLAQSGFEYGPIFQCLTRAWRRDGEVFAEVELPLAEVERASTFGLHPALMDAALHAMAFARPGDSVDVLDDLRLPFSWSDVALPAGVATMLRVHIAPAGKDALSITVGDQAGRRVVSVGSLVMRKISAADIERHAGAQRNAMFGVEWMEDSSALHVAEYGSMVLATCSVELHDALRSVDLECDVFEDMEVLGDAIDNDEAISAMVLLDARSLQGAHALEGDCDPRFEEPVEDVPKVLKTTLHQMLGSLQGWLADERFSRSRLVVITQGALATDVLENVHDLAGSAVWGMMRSAQAENPGRLVLVDVDGEDSSWRGLSHALALDEPQIALRDKTILVPRIKGAYSSDLLAPPGDCDAWRLDVEHEGTFEGLALVPYEQAEHELAAGEVRVEMRAAGLNFRDVLIALGMYPGEASIGSEGAGVVIEVGADVHDLVRGDRVMGLMGAMGTVANTDRRLLVRIPDGCSFTQAASVPIAFGTAYYGLIDLAGLKRGERVLVHAAAGGVGMAAVQIAHHLGAEVFATASQGKWSALRALGIADTHIASSRTLDFKDHFLEQTDGQGVDVVLNALAGEFVDASLAVLGNGGRFMEMGKTDIRDPLEIAAEYPNVAYRAFDLMESGGDRLREILTELAGLFACGKLSLSPITTWNVRRAQQAFRRMSQGGHVGKNVLRLPAALDPHGTVLLTGATGGLGALVARHLVAEHGVRYLLMASRQGPRARCADELVDELSRLGAEAKVVACDVSNREQVRELLAAIPADHPLDAVFHAAGVLDDGVIGSLTCERIDRVLAPKVDGAWNLHELTSEMDLSAFVLFSSIAGVMGAPGQANYAAANAFLDGLAARRRSLGLVGTSIAWGLWARASEMTGHIGELDRARISRGGLLSLSDEQGLALLDDALAIGEALVVSVGLDMSALRAQARVGELPGLWRELIRVRPRESVSSSHRGLARLLAQTAEDEHAQLVLDLVCAEAARVLGHPSSDAVDVRRTFKDLGFDSLAGVELRNRLASQIGRRLPASLVFDYPTPTALAEALLEEIAPESQSNGSLDLELDRLAQALAMVPAEDPRRELAVTRLQTLLRNLNTGGETNDLEDTEQALQTASADELYRFIDAQAGQA